MFPQIALSALRRMRREDEGQTLVEYSLIVVLISVAAIGVVAALGGDIGEGFSRITGVLDGAGEEAAR